MALPRLTGALRSFSNVTKQDNYNEEVTDLQLKRSKLHEQTVGLDLTWMKIVKFLNEKLEKSEMQSVNEDLKDILQAAKQIGDCPFWKRRPDGEEEDETMSKAFDRFKGPR
ncbi:activating signal cointegrator 1 complex subunit 3 isoform X2 [Lagenorhynchus albirostris]|uniref:Activating signal cointegrator 1 complex subunit 3 isoform X5 n=1 Tax=Tursiops truncatus TaxID=9739 RepID=A0A2U4AVR7_TURTR|nr:activating signal cointegrator 1 complex subunit 3 isoform X5 [Tursiops truncatus]XP_026945559.1 activating signal cointegrator 1 complex subunit 3 isoform X5 [Lagenorhynchus obliquidens]XP_059886164.1 activating signal cointegrator 1 complex subunit 3 isoform X3 [Delphinus delphis]XP_060023752.1 activating signal cointegrator 1 complex subunit 3 isoform X2 [Lagenorhynchus albirostris]